MNGSTLVPGEGFEPPTNGLQNRCSTPELTRLPLGYLPARVQASKSASYRVSAGGTKAPESEKRNQHPSAYLRQTGGGDIRLVTFAPGTAFGEPAILARATRSASVIADDDLVFICAERARLRAFSADGNGLTVRSPPDADSAMWLTDLSSHFVSSRQASITVSYRFYTVVSQGVSLGRDISISSYGLSYLFTFSGVWGGLRQREVRQL